MLFPSPLTGDVGAAMASFGENLRREREMRGVNLEEISASTRIGVRFLQALEEDDFAALPGGIFTRSFIRAYASYLGLDQEAVMAEFQTLAPPDDKLDFNRLGTKPSSGSRGGRSPIVLWLVAAALLAGGWALYRYSHRGPELRPGQASGVMTSSAPAANLPSPPATQPAAAPTGANTVSNGPGGETPALPSSSASVAGGSPGPAAGSAPLGTVGGSSTASPPAALPSAASAATKSVGALGQGDLVLQVAATERVWLAVSADGKKIFQQTLDPNAVQTFRATDSFDVTTGNAQGTILTLNGETQKPLGRHGELKKLHLTRQSLQSP
ncbi:MAG TPA: helix-turn-helix domain-containing protein [Terriglobia bacterium]|nr:helix-turn-helix domain-containing protein [Terriglobia bacterium]